MTTLTHLECSDTGERYEAGKVWNISRAGFPLLARYDLVAVRQSWSRDWIASGPNSMWRYAPVLPVRDPANIVSLGEGMTPLLPLPRLGARMGCSDLWVKDDATNPTASFKSRGMSTAVSMAKELGIKTLALPSAGNAASAAAAYAAAAGIETCIFMPSDVPQANFIECMAFGAKVELVEGLISDCAMRVQEGVKAHGWFDLSTMKEPYRTEGNKTIGYELAEQFRWKLPDAILFPTGGGEALIGAWKAFDEMEALGWIGPQRPKIISVQAEGCQPVVRAWNAGADHCEFWPDARTAATGLRVPKPFADRMILDILRRSAGAAIAVSDEKSLDAGSELAAEEGVFPAPEGAACFAALRELIDRKMLRQDYRIVIHNTGAGLKYLEAYSTRFPRTAASETDKLGGLITPR